MDNSDGEADKFKTKAGKDLEKTLRNKVNELKGFLKHKLEGI